MNKGYKEIQVEGTEKLIELGASLFMMGFAVWVRQEPDGSTWLCWKKQEETPTCSIDLS